MGRGRGSGSCQGSDDRLDRRRMAEAVRERRSGQRLHGQVEKTTPISTDLTSLAAAPSQGRQPGAIIRRPQRRLGAQRLIGYAFSSGYLLFLLAFGIGPMIYALYLSFTADGSFVAFDKLV